MAKNYYANKIYVKYHRQFEWEKGKVVFEQWKRSNQRKELVTANVQLVPALNLNLIAGDRKSIFTDDELKQIVIWLRDDFGANEIGIYEASGGVKPESFIRQINLIKSNFPGKLIQLGIQPGETLLPAFSGGVEDDWSAITGGLDNNLWLSPPKNCGQPVGSDLLKKWMQERASDERTFTWDLIVVGWDY